VKIEFGGMEGGSAGTEVEDISSPYPCPPHDGFDGARRASSENIMPGVTETNTILGKERTKDTGRRSRLGSTRVISTDTGQS
jgi:hypothetical protein